MISQPRTGYARKEADPSGRIGKNMKKQDRKDRMGLQYKRILLKLSGEAMAGEKHFGLDYPTVQRIC